MSDIGTWRVISEPYNRAQSPDGGWLIYGWPKDADPETTAPSTVVNVEVGGQALADLIVASMQTTSKIAEHALAEHAKGNFGIDPRGWRYAPTCATCKDTGKITYPDMPGVVGWCTCTRGCRLLDLHIAEKARDDARYEESAGALLGGREHPDDPYQPGPDEGPF